MDFFKNARKVVTSVRNSINSLSLSLDKYFDQTVSIPSELISLIGLITENNYSSRNASQSTLTNAGLIVYNYKKGTLRTAYLMKQPNISMAQACVLFRH